MTLRTAIRGCAVFLLLTGSVPMLGRTDSVTLEDTRELLRAYRHEIVQSVHRASEGPSALEVVRDGTHTANLVRLFILRDDSVYRLHGAFWAETCRAAGASKCVPSLVAGLKDPDPKWRAFSAGALGNLGEASAVPELVDLLWDTEVVPGAIRCLPDPEDPAECVHTVAHSAAMALGKLTDVEFHDDLAAWRQWSTSRE